MSFEIKDLGGFSKPLTKLIDVVSSGIGSRFRPRAIKKEADAEAYKIRAIAAAHADARVLLSNGDDQVQLGRITAFSDGDLDLAHRARRRVLSREVEGQLNIETISEHATKALPEHVSDEPVSTDWRRQFFAGAENVCDKDLQFLWGKVLAGEVATPGRYSLRTLEVLKNLSKLEAETFRKACGLAFQDGWIPDPGRDLQNDSNKTFAPYGFSYLDLLTLRDAGLMHDSDQHSKIFKRPSVEVPIQVLYRNNGIWMHILSPHLQEIYVPAFIFTRAGIELQSLIDDSPSQQFLSDVATSFRRRGIVVKKNSPFVTREGHQVMQFTEDF